MIASEAEITPEQVASHYDELDHFYREVWGEHVHHGLWTTGRESREEAVRALVQRVATEADIASKRRVIDIGCGYGATARMLAREFSAQVTAITITPAQHAFAKSLTHAENDPVYVLGDWLANDFLADSFDAAISIESSEHMPDKSKFFAEAFRVLRPGGRLVICAWLSAENPGAFQTRWLLEPICREGRMPHMGTAADYQQLATDAGFTVERWADVSEHVARTWPMIVRSFLAKLCVRPDYLRFLLSPHARNRVFAVTIFRIWIAYRTSAMRYGIFTLRK